MYALAFYIFLSILELKKECDVQCSHVMKSKTTLICLFTHTQLHPRLPEKVITWQPANK